MSAPSRGRVSLRLVQPPPWLIYKPVRSYIPDMGHELYILNPKRSKAFPDMCCKGMFSSQSRGRSSAFPCIELNLDPNSLQ